MTTNVDHNAQITVRNITDEDADIILDILQPKSSSMFVNDLLNCCEIAGDFVNDEYAFLAEIEDTPIGAFRFHEAVDNEGNFTAEGSINLKEEFEDKRKNLIQLLEWHALKQSFNRVSITPISENDDTLLAANGYKETLDQALANKIPETRLQQPTIYTKDLITKLKLG